MPVSDVCDHVLCVVCYTSMVITSERRCRRMNVVFFPMCVLCIDDLKQSEDST